MPARARRSLPPGLAMPIQSVEHPSAPASAARAMSGVLFCFDRCAATMCCSRLVSSADSSAAAPSLCRCPKPPADPVLECARIVAPLQQAEIVVALEHQRVAAGQARLDIRRRHPEVGQHAQFPRAVGDHELHGLARVVRHRKRTAPRSRRRRTGRGCRSRTRAARWRSARPPSSASRT